MQDKLYLFECECHSPEHRLVFTLGSYPTDAPELWTDVYIRNYRNVFKRIWVALKYICKRSNKYGHFDGFIMHYEDTDKMQMLLDEYKRLHEEWANRIKCPRKEINGNCC
jgi:hypothetical protein